MLAVREQARLHDRPNSIGKDSRHQALVFDRLCVSDQCMLRANGGPFRTQVNLDGPVDVFEFHVPDDAFNNKTPPRTLAEADSDEF